MARSVIVVTDGYVTVENEVFALVRRNLGNSNVFAFGIGSSVNRHLIEGIARAGQGEPLLVTRLSCRRAGRAPAQDDRLPVLTHLQARFDGLRSTTSSLASADGAARRARRPSGGDPGQVARRAARPAGARRPCAAQARMSTWCRWPRPTSQAGALRQLWARSRIQQLSDQEALEGGSGQREAITALACATACSRNTPASSPSTKSGAPARPAVPVNQLQPLPQGGATRGW